VSEKNYTAVALKHEVCITTFQVVEVYRSRDSS
jgi:hypothetical protein